MLVTSILLTVVPINNVKAAPIELTLGVPYSDALEGPQDVNYYKVLVNAGEHLFIFLDKPYSWTSSLGIKYGQIPTGSVNDGWAEDGGDSIVELNGTQAGYYYIIVGSNWLQQYGSYNITVLTNLPELTLDVTVSDVLEGPQDVIYYQVWINAGEHLFIFLDKPSSWTSSLGIKYGQIPTGSDNDGWAEDGGDSYLEILNTQRGYYYIVVASNWLQQYGSYNITVQSTNHAPNKPQKPTGPTTRVTGQSGKYSTSTTDPDGDQVQYRFDWDASGTHQYSTWTSLVNSGQTGNKSQTWNLPGTYVVKAQARDKHGVTGVWSNGLTVTVTGENNPPNKPKKPTGPGTRLVGQPGTYWANGTDPDGDKIQYRFDWNASGSHSYSAWTSLVNSGTKLSKNHTWTTAGTYVVKAQSKDEHGATSTWSNGLNVTVTVNHPPNQPQKPTGPTTRITGQQGTYWANGTDPDGDKIQYRFDWNASGSHQYSGWTSLVNSGTKLSKAHSWAVAGTYVVKVQSRDEHGATSNWSNGLTVIVTASGENHPPNQPKTPTGPTALLTGEQGIYWANGTDPDGDKIQYCFDWNASGSHEYSNWTSLVNSGQKLSKNHSWAIAGTYIVKVQSRDEHGSVSSWSNELTVSVYVNHPPNKPQKPTGPTSLQIGQQGTYWANGTDPDGDHIQFRYDWNASGSHTYSDWTSLVNSGQKLSMFYSWIKAGTYVVKVQSRDEHGATSVWSNGLTVIVST